MSDETPKKPSINSSDVLEAYELSDFGAPSDVRTFIDLETGAVGVTPRRVIPGGAGADWYARGVDGAAAREINEIPTAIPLLQESIFMPVGITRNLVSARL